MSILAVPLPYIKQGIVTSYDITGIYFIHQTKRCPLVQQKLGLYCKNTDLFLFIMTKILGP